MWQSRRKVEEAGTEGGKERPVGVRSEEGYVRADVHTRVRRRRLPCPYPSTLLSPNEPHRLADCERRGCLREARQGEGQLGR